MRVWWELYWGWTSNYVVCRLVTLAKVYSGLRSLAFCSSINISCCWKIGTKSDSQKFVFIPLLHVLSNSTVLFAFPYSCLLFKIWNKYAEIWLFVLMYLMCSQCHTPVDLPAWPTYELLQVLHFSRHTQLEFILLCGTLLQFFYTVLVFKKAVFKLVYLNKLVTVCKSRLWCVKVTRFFFCCVCVGVAFVCYVLNIGLFFRLWIICNEKI
jgi:hypothetical protein